VFGAPCVQRKSSEHLFEKPTLVYPFITEQAYLYPVSTLCRVLEVSVSGYYDWLKREPSQHAREDGELAKEIHRLFYDYRQVYGSPRIQVELRERGLHCSRERTARLMREMNLLAKRKRTKPIGTKKLEFIPLLTCWVGISLRPLPIPNG
jgi:hypothetical protein